MTQLEENCEKLAESMIVERLKLRLFFLKTEDVKMSNVRRICHRNTQRYACPVLVTFESAECKRTVMKNKGFTSITI